MKKLILMLAVASFGTGAMAQNGAAKQTAPAQTQTAKPAEPAKHKSDVKSTDATHASAEKSVGQKPHKNHKHTVEPTKK